MYIVKGRQYNQWSEEHTKIVVKCFKKYIDDDGSLLPGKL